MCLIVKHERSYPRKRGWKLLRLGGKSHYYTGLCHAERIEITKTRFAKANTTPIDASREFADSRAGTYPGGFHIFTRKSDAKSVLDNVTCPEEWNLCRVEFRKQVAFGTIRWNSHGLSALSTVVAQECKILEVQ